MVVRKGGACGSARRRGGGEEGCASRSLGLGWTPHEQKGGEGQESQPQGKGPPAVGVGSATGLWCPCQALMDDTEDVSLDFGNEEELAFRKAKVRYVETGFGETPPKAANSSIHVHSRMQSLIDSECIQHPVSPGPR